MTPINDFIETSLLDRQICFDIHSSLDITNLQIAVPSVRLRALCLIFRQYEINGFFNIWFNHYFSKNEKIIDPFLDTSIENSAPSGNDFLVYPTLNGPIPSIRLKQMMFAIQDLGVMHILERNTSYESVASMIKKGFPCSIKKIPNDPERFLEMREKIIERIDRSNKT